MWETVFQVRINVYNFGKFLRKNVIPIENQVFDQSRFAGLFIVFENQLKLGVDRQKERK